MSTAFAKILEKYGEDAVLHTSSGDEVISAFLQPVIQRRGEKQWSAVTALGERDTSRWLCFTSAVFPHEEGLWLEFGDHRFDVLKSEPFKVGGKISHTEAVLCIREEDACIGRA